MKKLSHLPFPGDLKRRVSCPEHYPTEIHLHSSEYIQCPSSHVFMKTTFIWTCCCSTLPPIQHWTPLQVIQSSSACSAHFLLKTNYLQSLVFLSNTKSQWQGSYGERERERERERDCESEKMTVWDRTRERRWHRVTSVIALAVVETHISQTSVALYSLPHCLSFSLSPVPSFSLRAWICYYAHKSLTYCLWITSLPVNKGYFHKKPPFHFSFNLITS